MTKILQLRNNYYVVLTVFFLVYTEYGREIVMKEEKKINTGLVVLVCLLFVAVIVMAVLMVCQKTQSEDVLLTEEEIQELITQASAEANAIFEEKAANVLKERDLTEAEIKEILVKYLKVLKKIDKKLPTNLDKQIDEVCETAIKLSIEQQELIKKAKEAKDKADTANIKVTLALIYSKAVAKETANQMTKEDYISALKKAGFSDEEIALVSFTVDETGKPVYD